LPPEHWWQRAGGRWSFSFKKWPHKKTDFGGQGKQDFGTGTI
jgi:hypothetical protein